MKTPLAWHNLLHKKVRTGIAVAGITFAVVLMFLQLGFLEAVKASATVTYDALEFDLCIRSRDYLYLAESRTFAEDRLTRAASVAGVRRAAPLLISSNSWRNPHNGERRAILCLGVPVEEPPLQDAELREQVQTRLTRPDVVLIDTTTRREYGPHNRKQFGPADHDPAHPVYVEMNQTTVRIAGHYTLGTGLSSGGSALMNLRGLRQATPWLEPGQISLGLVMLEPGYEAKQTAAQLRSVLPGDVDVLTRDEVLDEELMYWVWQTNYGRIFQTGVLVALVVGTAIVYQVLASDVSNMLPEYATMKAMGYQNTHLAMVIVQQATLLALTSFALGILLAEGLYLITTAGAGIPVRMTTFNIGLVFTLSLAMCILSGLAAARKAFRADPADLF